MSALLTQSCELTKSLNLPTLYQVALEITSYTIADPSSDGAEVFRAIHDFCPRSGWIWDDAHSVRLVTKADGFEAKGRIFKAELSDGENRGAVIRHLDGDNWTVSILTEAEGTTHLAEDFEQITTLKGDRETSRLHYRRYWLVVPGEASQVVAARFVKFGPPASR
ncbi:hypothetical protein [Rhabdaerophilum sp. SD176]|uniref:hypothetical protein n=1 Tax=Rhabdaerophilum sp. SD176 TaxID=2983548 RepID=UPI0024DFFD3E|nr:hypothetical protein [Rhabdaerophilum sp. SD176]